MHKSTATRLTRVLAPIAGLALAATTALAGTPTPPDSGLTAKKAQAQTDDFLENLPKPEFSIGDKVPKLELAGWVQGERSEPVEKGKVNIVECWATWCGPCIRMIPHLKELNEEYEGKDVNFVGVSVWEKQKGAELETLVKGFVKDHEDMVYPVAWDHEGSVAKNWLSATGTNGIPAAFIVNKKGELAWTGHPAVIDEPLKEIVEGTWDLKEAKAEFESSYRNNVMYPTVMRGIVDPATADEMYDLADALIMNVWSDNVQLLNAISWTTMTNDQFKVKDYDFCIRAANRACELTNWQEGGVIDTLARAWWEKGDHKAAIELQELAIKVTSDPNARKSLETTLESYKKQAIDG